MIRIKALPWFYQAEIRRTISQEVQQHLKVRRIKTNQQIIIFNGLGQKAICKIINTNELEILQYEQAMKNPFELRLALPYCELKTMNHIITQATELGCSHIDIVHTEYSCSNASHKRIQKKHIEKWHLLTTQACQQSENPYLPIISLENKLASHIELNKNKQQVVLGFTNEPASINKAKDTVLYVGPEGGFSPFEAELFSNAICLCTNKNVLRVETAVVSGLSIITQA